MNSFRFHPIFQKTLILAGLFLSSLLPLSAQEFQILTNGHAHNDYVHKNPLHDALTQGMFSIEVDVFLVKGELYVAHTRSGTKKKRRFEDLYIKPLWNIVNKNGGRVYRDGPLEFEMMIDLKTGGKATLKKVHDLLDEYNGLWTMHYGDKKIPGAVRVLLSGNGVKYEVQNFDPRFASVDASFKFIDSELDSNIIPRISANYSSHFIWKGKGEMPEKELLKLKDWVEKAHLNNRKIRFWNIPQKEAVWQVFIDAGVDWINIDDLKSFREFILSQ